MTQEIPESLIQFKENMDKILELVDDSITIAQEMSFDKDECILDQAKSYWYPHIELEIYDCTRWVGSSMCTMEDTLRNLLELSGVKVEESADLEDVFLPTRLKKKTPGNKVHHKAYIV